MIKAALVSPHGEVVATLRSETAASSGSHAVLDRVASLVERAKARVCHGGHLGAVGVGAPGFVDEDAGVVEFSANLGWKDLAVKHLLGGRLGAPVALGHDVRLGGRAEGEIGAARGAHDYLFVALGTGIAAALTLGGRQRRGPSGLAGEIGHVVVEPDGPPCRCGGCGCLEEVASASGIARRYRALVPGRPIGSAQVLELAHQGDAVAKRVWDTSAAYLGVAMAHVHAALQLELIVIGGGLAKSGSDLLEPVAVAMGQSLPCLPPPRLVLAELGDEAACLGAALLGRDLTRDVGADGRLGPPEAAPTRAG